MSDYGASRWVCQHKRAIIKVWGESSWRLSFGIHCQSFPCTLTSIRTLRPSSNTVSLYRWVNLFFAMIMILLWRRLNPNAFPLLFGVSAVVTWFRKKHRCISIHCNCLLVSLRSIYQARLSLPSVRDISLVHSLIYEIISCARKWNVSWWKCCRECREV